MFLLSRTAATKSWKPQIVSYVHRTWYIDTVYETDLVKAQDMSLNILPNIQSCCC